MVDIYDLKIMLGFWHDKAEEVAEIALTKYNVPLEELVEDEELVFAIKDYILTNKEPYTKFLSKKKVSRLRKNKQGERQG